MVLPLLISAVVIKTRSYCPRSAKKGAGGKKQAVLLPVEREKAGYW